MSPRLGIASRSKHSTALQPQCGGGGDGAGVVVFGRFKTKIDSLYAATFMALRRKLVLVPMQACY